MDKRTLTPYGDTGKPYRERKWNRGGGRGGRHRGQWGPRGERGGGSNIPPSGFDGRVERPQGRSRNSGNQTKPKNRLAPRPQIKKREDSSPLRASVANKIPRGFIFGCTNSTEGECLELNLFGLPTNNLSEVKKVCPGTALFLFNYEERMLSGVFAAASQGAENLIPNAWGGQFPAQVRVVPPAFMKQIPESRFKPVLQDNYFGRQKFIYHLQEEQVTNLCKLFDQPVPQVGHTRPPRYVLPYNRATVMKRTVARPNSGGKLFGGLRGVTITPDSVRAPPSKRGQTNSIFGGGAARSMAHSGQNSGTAMDTSDYSMAPQWQEVTSNPTGFFSNQTSPARFDPYANRVQNSDSTPVGQGLPSNAPFGIQGFGAAPGFSGGQNMPLSNSDPFGGDSTPRNKQGAWGSDEKTKSPVRYGEEKLKMPVQFGSDSFPSPTPEGPSQMEFRSGGFGAGPSHLSAAVPSQSLVVDCSTAFDQHPVGSPKTPPKKREGKFDWGRLTSSSGAPVAKPILQRDAEQQPRFGDGGGESGTPPRENPNPAPPAGVNRDPRLRIQGQDSMEMSEFGARNQEGAGFGGQPANVAFRTASLQGPGNVAFGAQLQEHQGNVGFGAQLQEHQGNVSFGTQLQEDQGNVVFGAQPQEYQGKVGFSTQSQGHSGNVVFGAQSQEPRQVEGNVVFGGQVESESMQEAAAGAEKEVSNLVPAPVLFSMGLPQARKEQEEQPDGGVNDEQGADSVSETKKPMVNVGVKRKAEGNPVYFETDEPYEYIKGMPIVTADHIMKRGIGNHSSLFTERSVGGFVCVPGMNIKKKKDLPPKEVKEEEFKLSERSQHFVKVATGFYSGGETKEEKYKNLLHGRLSVHWRTSCAKAWKVMKILREQAVSANRLHLFDQVMEESGYVREHGIIPVKDGRCPLF
ncbi:hypothetical protein BSKO_05415 [Bryopsis sp. KO-2023]|nr:hypothetical protein BSKO_05415 [Bryopsis sp. KO-2023]